MSPLDERPALPGLWADPNIAEFDGRFYIYATTDGVPEWGATEYYAWWSDDLREWSRTADPILILAPDGDVPWASGKAWAPTIMRRGEKYFFYFCGFAPALGDHAIGVAVADDPLGPFLAEREPIVTNTEEVRVGHAIDPATFADPVTGRRYLLWGNTSAILAELSENSLRILPQTLTKPEGLALFSEGAFLNHRRGLYHLTYSIGDTRWKEYRVGYATAHDIRGPWTYRGVILQQRPELGIFGTGHSSILNVEGTDDWFIVYHRFARPGGDGMHRETVIDRLHFDEDTGLMQVVIPTLGGEGVIFDDTRRASPPTIGLSGTARSHPRAKGTD
ncbi:family 43 glycosylhydrolase [Microbacterium sp. LWH12-1.2]|uniref:family 43 glycosylhydrolase n=1 Tax=Microbacterium sp. LWH12-1.2 TaxID=3135259 RepID=UPI00341535C6